MNFYERSGELAAANVSSSHGRESRAAEEEAGAHPHRYNQVVNPPGGGGGQRKTRYRQNKRICVNFVS